MHLFLRAKKITQKGERLLVALILIPSEKPGSNDDSLKTDINSLNQKLKDRDSIIEALKQEIIKNKESISELEKKLKDEKSKKVKDASEEAKKQIQEKDTELEKLKKEKEEELEKLKKENVALKNSKNENASLNSKKENKEVQTEEVQGEYEGLLNSFMCAGEIKLKNIKSEDLCLLLKTISDCKDEKVKKLNITIENEKLEDFKPKNLNDLNLSKVKKLNLRETKLGEKFAGYLSILINNKKMNNLENSFLYEDDFKDQNGSDGYDGIFNKSNDNNIIFDSWKENRI